MERVIKPKKCKVCGVEFYPFRTTDVVCSEKHARELRQKKTLEKIEKGKQRKTSERKAKLDLARITFNAYIRERDKGKPCICCGKPLGKDYQAGHYFSGGGHAAVLFDEDNVHAQRFDCNNDKAGNFVEYGVRLEERITPLGFELLRARAYEVKSWETEELDGVITYYRRKLKELREKK